LICEAELDGVTVFDTFADRLTETEGHDYNLKRKQMGLIIGGHRMDRDYSTGFRHSLCDFPYPTTREFNAWVDARRVQHNLNIEARLASAKSKL